MPSREDQPLAAVPEPGRASADLIGSALAVVAAGVLLAATAGAGAAALLGGIAAVQVALLLAATFGARRPGRIGGLVVGALAAGAADALVMVFPDRQLGQLLPVIGLSIVALFVHQLTRGVIRTRVVESLSDTAVLTVSVVALAVPAVLYHAFPGVAAGVVSGVVGAAALALAAGYVVDVVAPVPRVDPALRRGLLGVLLAAAVGAVVGYARLHLSATVQFSAGAGALLGAAVGCLVALLGVGWSFVTAPAATAGPEPAAAAPAARLRVLLAGFVPLALILPVGYMLALALRA